LKISIDVFLSFFETYGAKVSNWAWNKRWKDRPYIKYMGTTGKIYKFFKESDK
tara:strand:+ start:721 stop:879 length:159 start_codon:yes stop_codon:yes gene_type:complete